MSNSLQPHGLQHTRLPCPSPSPRAWSNSCPLRQWCHPTISPSVIPFSCLQSFPASGSFLKSQLFASGGQSIGASASASVGYYCSAKGLTYNVLVLTQLYLTLCDPMDCSPPDSSVHRIFQARILEWVAISYSRGSSQPRDRTHVFCVFCISRRILSLCHLGCAVNTLPIDKFEHGSIFI